MQVKTTNIKTTNIILNGENYKMQGGDTISDLLELLKIPLERVAVMKNESVIKKLSFPSVHISENDRVEILTFAAGG